KATSSAPSGRAGIEPKADRRPQQVIRLPGACAGCVVADVRGFPEAGRGQGCRPRPRPHAKSRLTEPAPSLKRYRRARPNGWASGDPGCLERARVVEDRGPVVAGPDVADLAVAQAVDVDAVPLDVASAGGDGEDGALLGAAHDHAHHNLVALAEDVVNRDVRIGEGGDHAGEQPGDV